MLKQTIALLALLGGTAPALAQGRYEPRVKPGVKVGLSIAGLAGVPEPEPMRYRTGLHGGLFFNVLITEGLSVVPEALYSLKGATYSGLDYRLNSTYIDVPVPVRLSSSGGLYAEAGPQLGLLLAADYRQNGVETDIKPLLETLDIGYVAGVGFQAPRGFGIGLRYNGGARTLAEGTVNPLVATGARNSVFQLFGTYQLNITKKRGRRR